MNPFTCLQILWLITISTGSLPFEKLEQVGIIRGNSWNYKIINSGNTLLLTVGLVPNITAINNCGAEQITKYKNSLQELLDPVNKTLEFMLQNIGSGSTNLRFVGAVIGGIALGIATAAQITGGIALYNTRVNAEQISNIKDALSSTNQAVLELKKAGQQTVTVISALQEEINDKIIPQIDKISCDVMGLKLGLILNQYLSKMIVFIGDNLKDPIGSPLSIQAISQIFGGDYKSMLKETSLNPSDFLDLLESDSITGRIIYVDLENYFFVVRVSIPVLNVVEGSVVQQFNIITYQESFKEWRAVIPSNILIRSNYISGLDLSLCKLTTNSVICPYDYSYPLTYDMIRCLTQNTSYCGKELITSSYVPRYALYNGVLFANCLSVTCTCAETNRVILQSSLEKIKYLDNTTCQTYRIDEISVKVGKYLGSRYWSNVSIDLGPQIFIDKIDLSNQLGNINQTLSNVGNYIKESNNILELVKSYPTLKLIVYVLLGLVILVYIILIIIIVSYIRISLRDKHDYQEIQNHHMDSTLGEVYYIDHNRHRSHPNS